MNTARQFSPSFVTPLPFAARTTSFERLGRGNAEPSLYTVEDIKTNSKEGRTISREGETIAFIVNTGPLDFTWIPDHPLPSLPPQKLFQSIVTSTSVDNVEESSTNHPQNPDHAIEHLKFLLNQTVGQSASSFAASLITAIVVFAIEVLVFVLIKDRFARIYQPRTYLVPEKERTAPPRSGWFLWTKSVLSTSNSEFIQKCGLDAYFFLRYLRTLIKIFVPALCLILPVLIPVNLVHGRGGSFAVGDHKTTANVTGLDTLAWGNVRPDQTNRYWAHLVLAVALVAWVCYISFDELRGYIRMRQAYLTSPQHRLRASATTVLVSSIPSKWCTVEALDGLYDVFPGGLRNIWINRNFDDLTDKIKERDKLATTLEGAETDLIKKCWKAHQKKLAKEAKKERGGTSKESKQRENELADQEAERNAHGGGVSTNNPHQVRHTVDEAVNDESDSETDEAPPRPPRPTIPLVGEGIEAVTKGLGKIRKGMFGGLRNAHKDMNDAIDTTNGFVLPEEEPTSTRPTAGRTDSDAPHARPDVPRKDTHAMNPYRGTLDSRVDPNTPALRQSNWQGSPIDDHEDAYDMARGRSRAIQDDHDDRPLSASSPGTEADEEANSPKQKSAPGKVRGVTDKLHLTSTKEEITYPPAYEEDFATDDDHNVVWKKYIAEKDRDTTRLPIFGWKWMISLPLMGQKVDTIYYCRKELARLNLEIEQDQENPERFPLMNSAFVQFNHQVAAHMACQSLSHHLPKQMAPRLVEISPNDVIWDNMSIPWWQNYIRTAMVVTVVIALIILWAIPVSFTSGLSQINQLAQTYSWLKWLTRAPKWLRSVLQGVLPALFLGILLFLLPIILRFLVRMQGTQTGMLVELSVQKYYLFFLFVQLFIVVTIANAAATVLAAVKSVDGIKHFASSLPTLIGQSIPRASNYFFSYMLLQALSVSAGALVQIGGLIGWFIMAPLFDNTARSKFKRQTSLSQVSWGTFFPVYTNLACIGLIYSVIAPLILVFNVITFTLFWFVYRYNTLYVTKFSFDTGGLLYPNAINYTFVGLYTMEFALIGMFFLVRDADNNTACAGQGIAMAAVLICTAVYQWLLNSAFAPLFRYIPITLEDDAVERDEEFARAMGKKHAGLVENEQEGEDLNDALSERERRSLEEDRQAEEYEMQRINKKKNLTPTDGPDDNPLEPTRTYARVGDFIKDKTGLSIPGRPDAKRHGSWADRERNRDRRSKNFGKYPVHHHHSESPESRRHHAKPPHPKALDMINNFNPLIGNAADVEAQRQERSAFSNALFSGINDELEDLTPEERDVLVQRAFQHSALRARRPVIWIPRDGLGVSDDEVLRMGRFSKFLWSSNEKQGLDRKGRCVFSGSPPDFSEVDLIQL